MSSDGNPLIPKTNNNTNYGNGSNNGNNKDSGGKPDRFEEIRLEIEDVKDVMKTNIDKAIKRGEDLEIIGQKAQDLEANAGDFRVRSRDLKSHMRCKNIKVIAGVSFIVAIIITILVLAIVYGSRKT